MKDACMVNCAFQIALSLNETLVDVTNGCCGLSWRDIFSRLAAGILLRERSTGCVVHTDMVDGDGEGEPMPRLKTELEGHDGWVFVEERSVTWPEVVKGEKLLPNLLQWDLPFRDTCDGERRCSKN